MSFLSTIKEPGLICTDLINRLNRELGEATGVINPCSEVPLPHSSSPLLDMHEAYKIYLESTIQGETFIRYSKLQNSTSLSSKGEAAQIKLDELRNSNPELFL